MVSMVKKKSLIISINDILDELMNENKRLLNELLFANKLKTHLIKIHSKYETLIDCEDKQHFQTLSTHFETIDVNSSGHQLQDNETHDSLIDDYNHIEISDCVGSAVNDCNTSCDDFQCLSTELAKDPKTKRYNCLVNTCHKSYVNLKDVKTHLQRVHQMRPIGDKQTSHPIVKSEPIFGDISESIDDNTVEESLSDCCLSPESIDINHTTAGTVKKHKQSYKKISDELREMIIKSMDSGLNGTEAGLLHDVLPDTCRTIYRKYRKKGLVVKKPVGHRPPALSDRHKQMIIEWIGSDCTLTLEEVRQKLSELDIKSVSLSTISKVFKPFHYSCRRIDPVSCVSNGADVIDNRYDFAVRYGQLSATKPPNIYFVDTIGVEVNSRRIPVKSNTGAKHVRALRYRKYTISLAISQSLMSFCDIQEKEYNCNEFPQVLDKLFSYFVAKHMTGAYIIVNNTSLPLTQELEAIISERGHHPVLLPPDSPFLNPINGFIDKWKREVKAHEPTTEAELHRAVIAATDEMTGHHWDNDFANMDKYIALCLNREVIDNCNLNGEVTVTQSKPQFNRIDIQKKPQVKRKSVKKTIGSNTQKRGINTLRSKLLATESNDNTNEFINDNTFEESFSDSVSQESVDNHTTSGTVKKHKQNKRISDELREMIIKSMDSGLNGTEAGLLHDVIPATCRMIYNKYRKTGLMVKKPLGHRPRALSDRHKQMIIEWIDSDCTLTLEEVRQKLLSESDIKTVSLSTIGRVFKPFHYSCRTVDFILSVSNAADVIDSRYGYVSRYRQLSATEPPIIFFVDTIGVEVHSRRIPLRSNTVGKQSMALGHRKYTISLAISQTSISFCDIQEKEYKCNEFPQVLDKLFPHFAAKHITGAHIIVNNTSSPLTQELETMVSERGHHLVVIPHDSPFLNPLNYFIDKWKREVKAHEPTTEAELHRAVIAATDEMTGHHWDNDFANMDKYMDRCLNREVIDNCRLNGEVTITQSKPQSNRIEIKRKTQAKRKPVKKTIGSNTQKRGMNTLRQKYLATEYTGDGDTNNLKTYSKGYIRETCDSASEELFASLRQKYSCVEDMRDPTTNRYDCPVDDCPLDFANVKSALNRHLGVYHNIRPINGRSFVPPFVCSQSGCDARFTFRVGLDLHFKTVHQNIRHYMCNECHKTYGNYGQFNEHKRTHRAETTYRCRRCHRRFATIPEVRKHRESDHGLQPELKECCWPGCGYRTKYNGLLTQHVNRVHLDHRPHVCSWPECGKRFTDRRKLNGHKNCHLKIKPYACVWPGCTYRCTLSENMYKHNKSHTK